MKKIIITILIIVISSIIGTAVIATTGTSTTDSLNIRDSANSNGNIIGTLKKDAKVNITGEKENWFQIDYNGQNAYVSKDYIEIEQNKTNEENESLSTVEENTHNSTIKLEGKTTLYILPLINSLKLSTLEEGSEILVISDNGKWLYVQTATESGWITANKHFSENNNNIKKENNEIEQVNELSEENAENEESENEQSKSTNTTIEKEANTVENKNSEEDKEEDTTKYPTTMYVIVDSANIRKSASSSSESISGASKNESIKVIGKEGEWYKVDTEDGVGYIRGDLLSSKKN